MRHQLTSSWRDVGRVLLGLSAVWLVVAAVPAAAQTAVDRPVTFTKGWFDGTSKNPNNIEPRNTTAWGRRSAQNMFGALGNQIMELTDEQYQQELAKRRAYLDLTQGWDTVVGCRACTEPPAPSPPPARAAAAR